MAKISSYNLDTTVSKNDKVIGTDSGGSTTKNFKLEDVAGFLDKSNLINVNGQVVYKLTSGSSPNTGEFNRTGGSGNFSNITSFKFSHTNANDLDIETYLDYFIGLKILIIQTDNQNNFGLYNVNNVVSSTDHSTFEVVFIEGSGSMVTNKHYAIAHSPKGQSDKNFISNSINFSANTPQTIAHNLNKFPAVTTVDSAGNEVVGDVQHININSFKITFTSAFSGKVHAN